MDKTVVKWNDGMCSECWDRLMIEAKEMAEADAEAEARALAAASVSSSSRSNAS